MLEYLVTCDRCGEKREFDIKTNVYDKDILKTLGFSFVPYIDKFLCDECYVELGEVLQKFAGKK